MFDRMQPEQRKEAIAEYRRLAEMADGPSGPGAFRRLRAD